jgi:hypothetical protein
MKLPPFKAWPQRPPMWAWPVVNLGFSPGIWATPKVTKDFGYVFIDLGPFAIELDGREYVKWMTGVILPEARSMAAGFPDPDPEGVKLNYGPFDECTCEPSSGIWHDEKCPQARS